MLSRITAIHPGALGALLFLCSAAVVQAQNELRAGGGGESVMLRHKAPAGQTYYLETTADTARRLTGGLNNDIDMRTRFQQTLGVIVLVEKAAPNEGAELVLTFDRVRQQSKAMDNVWTYDSDVFKGETRTNMLARAMSPLVNKKVRLKLDAEGDAVSLKGMEEILLDMETSALGDATSTQYFQEAKRSLTNEFMKFMWGDARLALFPNRQVSVGNTWHTEVRQPIPLVGAVIRKYTCTLKQIEEKEGRQIATVAYQATAFEAPDAVATPGPNGAIVQFRNGYVRGSAAIDVEAGLPLHQTEQVRTETAMEIPMFNDPAATQQFISDATSDVSYSIISTEQRTALKRPAAR